MPNLLLEIYNEEIPAGYIRGMLAKLHDNLVRVCLRLPGEKSPQGFATPRRFCVFIQDLEVETIKTISKVVGPPENVAFKDGKPTKAAEGFAKKLGVSVADLLIEQKDNKNYIYVEVIKEPIAARDYLAKRIPEAISDMDFSKSMRWMPSDKFSWPRPIRHILALLDDEVIEFDFHGIPVGRITRGHPFHGAREIEIKTADVEKFKEVLEKEYVILNHSKRKEKIENRIKAEFEKNGAVFAPDLENLLDEVTKLVEWPEVIVGKFDEEFLPPHVPKEVVKAAMMEHQRYFPMERGDGTLINKFATVSNRPKRADETEKEFKKIRDSIRAGNERVIRARLADAKFFYDEDRKKKLEDYVPELAGMVYHEKLGSNYDKVKRLETLCGKIGPMLGYDETATGNAKRAALLCRADLVTQMVGEFPSLQGVIGGRYSDENEDELVTNSIKNYYWPQGAMDKEPPKYPPSVILLIADKVDTLVSFFAIGEEPKGNQDPYALRRAAIALNSILMSRMLKLNIELARLVKEGCKTLNDSLGVNTSDLMQNVMSFLRDRLTERLKLETGQPIEYIRAVLARGMNRDLYKIKNKLDGLIHLEGPGWFDLVKSVQRCRPGKIAKDLEKKGLDVKASPEAEKFKPEDDEEGKYEHKLCKLFQEVKDEFISRTNKGEYAEAGKYFLEKMKDPINEFFDKVFVNVEDEEIRLNRLRLTGAIYELFAEHFADMAEIAGPEKTSGQ
ncbi:MAG: glycine--tRNA ligase subunit beta [Planctomycetota bacterium]|jgi:glycyl-tRNA synthetase beta chain